MTKEQQWAFDAACNLLSSQFDGFSIVAFWECQEEGGDHESLRCDWGVQFLESNNN